MRTAQCLPGPGWPRRRVLSAALLLVACFAVAPGPVAYALPVELRALLNGMPADRLPGPLRRYEAEHGSSPEAAEAAMLLGQLLYARGEYRSAAETFARAAARLAPPRKSEARYWSALSWLALGEPEQTRAALDEVIAADPSRRALALLAVTQAWERAHRPDRAAETLALLLAGPPGEAGPAALERAAALAEDAGQAGRARAARLRLRAEYPRSMEAAAMSIAPPSRPPRAERPAALDRRR